MKKPKDLPSPNSYLSGAFHALWAQLFGRGRGYRGTTVFNLLKMMYGSEGRFYHNMNHIYAGLQEIDANEIKLVRDYGIDLNLLRMAWWFHDVVYDVWRKDNEYRSAVFAKHILQANDLQGHCGDGVSFLSRIMTIICATNYTKIFDNGIFECCVIRDIDLLSLAAEPKQFDINTENIAKEFVGVAHITQADFDLGRHAFLTDLYKKKHIYETGWYQRMYDERAHKNIKRALKKIELARSVDADKYVVDRNGHLRRKKAK